MKKKIIVLLLTACMGLAACGSKDNTSEVTASNEKTENVEETKPEENTENNNVPDENALELGYTFYDDIISYVVEEMQLGWDAEPEAMELSYIYRYSLPSFGFTKFDINNDGILELAFGEDYSGVGAIYDLYTLMPDGTVSHLFSGGERDILFVSGDLLIEQGSSGADDSIQKKYHIENGLLSLVEEKTNDFDSRDTFDYIEFDSFFNYVGEVNEETDEADELFMPSSEIEVRAGKEEFDTYEEIISYLEPGEAYAYVDVLGTGDPVLLIATDTYDYEDGINNAVAMDAVAFYKNNRGIVYGTFISSNSTACPIAIGDGLLYGFGYHAINTQCVSSDTEAFMYMSNGTIEYDTDGNGTYIGFVRNENKVGDDDNNMHDITPEEYDALFAEYEKAQVVNFTVVE